MDSGPVDPAALRLALPQLPMAAVLVDGHGVVRELNAAAEALYGVRAADALGRPALSLGVAASETAAAAELLSRLVPGETWSGRFPLRRGDGSRVAAWVQVASLADGDGPPWRLILALDVADLIDDRDALNLVAEEQAEGANLLLQGLLESVPLGMAIFDRSLRFVRVNETMAGINGVPAEDHVGRHVSDVVETLPELVVEAIREVFESGASIAQREVVTADRTWLVSYYPVRRGDEVRWVGTIAMDVTDWREGERERARLLDAERDARRAAELAAERLDRLQLVTGRLTEASDRESVVEIVVRHGRDGVGAAAAALCLVVGDELRLAASTGLSESAVTTFGQIPLDGPFPINDAVRRGELILLGSLDERDERYPAMVGVPSDNRSFAAVPMVIDGRSIGTIVFSWAHERTFDPGEQHFLLALGRQAAQALERARLYESERAARAAAEEAGERMRFLAEASRVLSSSLDYEVTLGDLARLAVPEVADACLIHLFDEDDELRLVVSAHRKPELGPLFAGVAGGSTRNRTPQLLGRAAAFGETIVLDEVPDELLRRVAQDEGQLEVLRSLELRSGIIVPLRVQGRILGVITFATIGDSEHHLGADARPFVEDLAGRVAVAVENSRSHQARTEVARTLQRSLLPPHLPSIPGLELAQRYHSMGDVEVGGDFFDVFPAGDGRWGVVMGDVCGKGVAAASLTALARYTVRAGAIEGEPAAVLRLLNRAILDAEVGERFCTIAHAMVEPLADSGDVRVVLACGGHPLPLLLTAAGSVSTVGEPGSVIGLFEEVDLTEVEVRLEPGDALALYTDGFTEARSPEGRFDPGLLARSLAAAGGRSAEGIADVVDREVRAFEAGHQRDDMALLVLRVPLSSS